MAVSHDLEEVMGAPPTHLLAGSRMALSAVCARALLLVGAMGLGAILILGRMASLRPESLQPGDQFVAPPLVNLKGRTVPLDAREDVSDLPLARAARARILGCELLSDDGTKPHSHSYETPQSPLTRG